MLATNGKAPVLLSMAYPSMFTAITLAENNRNSITSPTSIEMSGVTGTVPLCVGLSGRPGTTRSCGNSLDSLLTLFDFLLWVVPAKRDGSKYLG